ncbi:receptor-type tyrosine-protein phosphatase F-like isoform X2 [Corticium candelabrum]|nr:receptor-type tyrosine-protein phosphatase F-like isoform X2 [Corticium candelabrum]
MSSVISVDVKYAPEFVKIRPSNPVRVKGQNITLNCSAGGNPSPDYEWRGGKSAKGSTLELTSLEFKDEGTYRCVARNTIEAGAKTSRASVQLIIEGPPQRCVVLSVESYNDSEVNVKVNCPENGNSSVTEYRIEYQLDNGTSNMLWEQREFSATDSQPFVVVGLSPFTNYSFRATASNRHGYEPGSLAAVNVVPVTTAEGSPTPPQNLRNSSVTSSSIALQWERPISFNGAFQYYTVYNSIGDASYSKSLNIASHDNLYTLKGLKPYTEYRVYVRITNNAKSNPESSPSNMIIVRTLAASPQTPDKSLPSDVSSTSTVVFVPPTVNDENGPIEYVDIIVYEGTTGSNAPLVSDVPRTVGPYEQEGTDNTWYVTARYNYMIYKQNIQGKQFTVGNDSTSGENNEYKNVPLKSDSTYFIYIRVVAMLDNGSGMKETAIGEPLRVLTKAEASSVAPIAGAAAVGIIFLLLVILVVVVLRRRRSGKMTDSVYINEQVAFSSVKQVESVYDEIPLAPVISVESLSVTSYEGTTAVLPCDAAGEPKPIIKWFRNGKEISEKDEHFVILGDKSLQIANVMASDSGKYRCTATNSSGVDEQVVELIVRSATEAVKKPNFWTSGDTPSIMPKVKSHQSRTDLHSINLEKFPDCVAAMHQDHNAGICSEFKTLGELPHNFSAEVALANLSLNRYKNILTYDHSRVVLPVLSGMTNSNGNYIAAAFVDGYRTPKKYIASQGPQEHTVADNWRMIWAENVPTIVMLTHLIEKNKIKCHQYWPKNVVDSMDYNGLIVTFLEKDSFADYEIRKFSLTLGDETRIVTQYHYTAWPDHGVPKFATPLLSFIRRINREYPKNRGSMVVHCSAGVGRTGTFIVIDTMLERIEYGEPIDIYSCVASLRTKRQDMVQTEAQYGFIHDAVLEALTCGNTQIPVQNLRTAVAKLSKKDAKTGKTGFECHFQVLQTTGPQMDKQLCKAGSQPAVTAKNRYQDILPLDVQRVILRLEEAESEDSEYVNTQAGADYINASYLDGYHHRDAYITTQGPLAKTTEDFWKMVWEQNCVSIVMLASLQENGEEMCHQYWPASGNAQYGQYTVLLSKETNLGEYVIRKFNLSKGSQSEVITQFQYTAWPENSNPKTLEQLFDMQDQLQKWQQGTGNKTIIVHCNNGVDRSGTFCGILSLVELLKVEGVVDVFLKVRSMRIQHPNIVQTLTQYRFMYDALLVYLDNFDTYANFK